MIRFCHALLVYVTNMYVIILFEVIILRLIPGKSILNISPAKLQKYRNAIWYIAVVSTKILKTLYYTLIYPFLVSLISLN